MLVESAYRSVLELQAWVWVKALMSGTLWVWERMLVGLDPGSSSKQWSVVLAMETASPQSCPEAYRSVPQVS